MKDLSPLRLAIIGCGAVTELGHLPAATAIPEISTTLLVDLDIQRARRLAEDYGVPFASSDFREALEKADAAVLAVPHHLHFVYACELLRNGIAVLVEKPLAPSPDECRQMIRISEEKKVILTVGLQRRHQKSARMARRILQRGLLGEIRSFDFREGNVYRWPVRTDFYFRKESAGGGVLMDTGAHTLDQLIWWLGDVVLMEYLDDCYGGVEADCRLQLKLSSGATGIVELSRTREMSNTAIIEASGGRLEVPLRDDGIVLQLGDDRFDLREKSPQSYVDVFICQLRSFVGAVRGLHPPEVKPEEGARVIELVEECYRKRQKLELPWVAPAAQERR